MLGLLRLFGVQRWKTVAPRFLPFADAASAELPLGRLMRLALFQITVGLAAVLLVGTLNRVMIVELHMPAWLVSVMVSLPLLAAPARALIGFRSDQHRSALGWRRVPYLWIGSLLLFGGLSIMPFSLLVLTGDGVGPAWPGYVAAALAFLLVGTGMQTVQTAGLALATDLAPPASRPRVVALMYVMLLVGQVGCALAGSALLADFSNTRLVQVVQGAAVVTFVLNAIALWKQEPRNRDRASRRDEPVPAFGEVWRAFAARPHVRRFLWTVALGALAFNMQDIVLEPYGGEILGLSVAGTTSLTALLAGGALAAFALSARLLGRGGDPMRIAATGALLGLPAFSLVIFSAPMDSPSLFRAGTLLIGFGGGVFSVGTLVAAMEMDEGGEAGLALGAWGAVHATAAGGAVALGGTLRDLVGGLAMRGEFGTVLQIPSTGYSVVYHLEMLLLFAALVAIGPLAGARRGRRSSPSGRFGLAELPG